MTAERCIAQVQLCGSRRRDPAQTLFEQIFVGRQRTCDSEGPLASASLTHPDTSTDALTLPGLLQDSM